MKKLKLIPAQTNIPFLPYRRIALAVSGLLVIASLGIFFSQGLNFGIDFRGGTMIEIGTKGPANIAELRSRLGGLGLGDIQIQKFGADNDVLIRVERQKTVSQSPAPDELSAQGEGEGAGQTEGLDQSVVKKIRDELGDEVSFRRVEVVGPKVSGELVEAGVLAIISAVILMLIYIWFRFEWQFSVGAVMALVHDVILTIGIFSVIQLEFNLSIIAALLTIVGYSMNDTVVVYDRVRENLRKFKKMDLAKLLNLAVNETLSRTVMTSVTTLLALGCLYAFGGEVIRGFTFAMIWGVVVGTYSSVFIASPLLLSLNVKRDWSLTGDNSLSSS